MEHSGSASYEAGVETLEVIAPTSAREAGRARPGPGATAVAGSAIPVPVTASHIEGDCGAGVGAIWAAIRAGGKGAELSYVDVRGREPTPARGDGG
jgi:hypothetical protein